LTEIQPIAPKFNAFIKTHKDDKIIRPVINNIQAPSYKLVKYLNKKLNKLINLPYTYATKKSKVAQELSNIQINDQHKITTLDIKDLHINLPSQNIISITKCWLNINNNQTIAVKQNLEFIRVIQNQNYFKYNDKYFKLTKSIAMVSPISSTLTEIYLQFFGELTDIGWGLEKYQTIEDM
jgi:hypothetical protein